MIDVDPWTSKTFGILYEIFTHDFKESQPTYNGKHVWFFSEIDDGKEVIFWHLTHREDKETKARMPDLRRSERLAWVRSLIDHSAESSILAWDFKEGDGTIKTYVWLKDYDFLVIMKKYRDGGRRLITSFYIDYSHKRRELQKKFKKRIV